MPTVLLWCWNVLVVSFTVDYFIKIANISCMYTVSINHVSCTCMCFSSIAAQIDNTKHSITHDRSNTLHITSDSCSLVVYFKYSIITFQVCARKCVGNCCKDIHERNTVDVHKITDNRKCVWLFMLWLTTRMSILYFTIPVRNSTTSSYKIYMNLLCYFFISLFFYKISPRAI